MPFNNIESNVKVIKNLESMSKKRKAALLLTQMHTIELLILDDATELTHQEQKKAELLYGNIETYRNAFLKN